jgi:hypothetical protein
MFVNLLGVYDDGSRPEPSWTPPDRRVPLAIRSGEDVTINIRLFDTAGGACVLPIGTTLQLVARGPGSEARELARATAVQVSGNLYKFTIHGYDTQAIPAQTGTWDIEAVTGSPPTACVVVIPTSEFALDSTYYPPLQRPKDGCGR